MRQLRRSGPLLLHRIEQPRAGLPGGLIGAQEPHARVGPVAAHHHRARHALRDVRSNSADAHLDLHSRAEDRSVAEARSAGAHVLDPAGKPQTEIVHLGEERAGEAGLLPRGRTAAVRLEPARQLRIVEEEPGPRRPRALADAHQHGPDQSGREPAARHEQLHRDARAGLEDPGRITAEEQRASIDQVQVVAKLGQLFEPHSRHDLGVRFHVYRLVPAASRPGNSGSRPAAIGGDHRDRPASRRRPEFTCGGPRARIACAIDDA